MSQNFLAMNIVMLIGVVLTFGMMTLWARATRGRWPGRRRLLLTGGYCLALWVFGNVAYFYFRSH